METRANPIAVWNEELQRCKLDLELLRQTERRLRYVEKELERRTAEAETHRERLEREEADVERLHEASFAAFWLRLFGKLDDRLDAEQREVAEAKLKLDAALAAQQSLETERGMLLQQLEEVRYAETRLRELMDTKETWIREHDPALRAELETLTSAIAVSQAELKEIREAEQAGRLAEDALRRAANRLDSASEWGMYDALGGGMFATMVKHGRIDEARDHIHASQHYLRKFASELKDLRIEAQGEAPQIGDMLTFADYFFDGLISDWMVQGKIRHSLESVRDSQTQVSRALREVARRRERAERNVTELRERCAKRVETYTV